MTGSVSSLQYRSLGVIATCLVTSMFLVGAQHDALAPSKNLLKLYAGDPQILPNAEATGQPGMLIHESQFTPEKAERHAFGKEIPKT